MDKVQFQLEATLPELKDLYEKGLFTKSEINQITKRRTALESSLIRQNSRKEDYFKYAEYEINLERLRKVRWKKLKYHINPPPPSASTYSLPRRALYILKRASVKFPGDLTVWLAYVEYASREGMRKVVGKGLTNALQHHPTSSTLYLLQTYYHLHPGSPFPREAIPSTSKLDLPSASSASTPPPSFSIEGIDPARTTLLLGLRLLPESRDLWREYIKLELGWVEALRRRWKLLGIKEEVEGAVAAGDADAQFEGDQDALRGGEGAFGPEGEDARKAILEGQLVVHALTSALEAITPTAKSVGEEGDGMAFRDGLIKMLRRYPSPLRAKCLFVLYEDLRQLAAQGSASAALGARAKLTIVTKGLYDRAYDPELEEKGEAAIVLEGVELVEELGRIGKEMRKVSKIKEGRQEWLEVAGGWIVEQIGAFKGDVELHEYLASILSSLTKPSLAPPPSLLLSHLALLAQETPDITIARSYAAIYPANPAIQLYRLSAESHGQNVEIAYMLKVTEEVARSVTRSGLNDDERSQVRAIWKTWVQWEAADVTCSAEQHEARWKVLLRESLKSGAAIPDLHSDMVGHYILDSVVARHPLEQTLRTVGTNYQPRFSSYDIVFREDTSNEAMYNFTPSDWKKLYESWRAVSRNPFELAQAALSYASKLLGIKGKGKEAYDVIEVVKREIRADEDVERYLEKKWKVLLDTVAAASADERLPDGVVLDTGLVEDESMEESADEDDEEDDLMVDA